MGTRLKADATPLLRSLIELKKQGFSAVDTCRASTKSGTSPKLLGFIDILAIHPTKKMTVAVVIDELTTARTVDKILGHQLAAEWLASGNRIHVHTWSKKNIGSKKRFFAHNLLVTPVTI